jgi:hypothetical protein
MSAVLVGGLARLRPCVGTLPYLLLSWFWLPGQVSSSAASARRLHALATSFTFLYALFWVGLFLGLRFGGLRTAVGFRGALLKQQSTQVLVTSLGIPPWAPVTDLIVHSSVAVLALAAYRYGQKDRVLNIHKRWKPFLGALGSVSWIVQVAALAPSIPSALLYLLLLVAAMLPASISSPGRRPASTGRVLRAETTGTGSVLGWRRRAQKLVLMLALVLSALHAVARFVFQWEWIRMTSASQSVCGYLFGLRAQLGYRDVLAQGANLMMLRAGRFIDLNETVAMTWTGYRLLSSRAAALVSLALLTTRTTLLPGIFTYVVAALTALATLAVEMPIWGSVTRAVAATATAGLGLAAIILGIILPQTKRSMPPIWGLPHFNQSICWNVAMVWSALAWSQHRVALPPKPNVLGRLLPSEYVANFLTWTLAGVALAALAQDWVLMLVLAALALGVRLGQLPYLSARVWLPLHVWAFLVWSLRCGLCGIRTATFQRTCSLSQFQCLTWAGLVTITAAAWALRVQLAQDQEREKRS